MGPQTLAAGTIAITAVNRLALVRVESQDLQGYWQVTLILPPLTHLGFSVPAGRVPVSDKRVSEESPEQHGRFPPAVATL